MQTTDVQVDRKKSNSLSSMKSSGIKSASKCSWQENHANKALSGIEFRRGKSNELVNFITIKHDEILDPASSFRIAIIVDDEDNTFKLPPKQTFEEMIQAKRRQQMLLYGAGNFATNTSALSERAARRVAAMARRQSSLNVAINRQNSRNLDSNTCPNIRSRKSSKSSRSKSSKRPSSARAPTVQKSSPTTKTVNLKTTPKLIDPNVPSTSEASRSLAAAPVILNASDDSLTSETNSSKLITSMKELARQNPTLGPTDKKQIRTLLRSAAPGASIVLANGTVIKKSRRGGARAGAGRKRNRPSSNGHLGVSGSSHDGERDTGDESRETTLQLDNDSTNHSFASVSTQPLIT